jgi:hypothetical protein
MVFQAINCLAALAAAIRDQTPQIKDSLPQESHRYVVTPSLAHVLDVENIANIQRIDIGKLGISSEKRTRAMGRHLRCKYSLTVHSLLH